MNIRDEQIKSLLQTYQHMAVYGLSPSPEKPSHYVPAFLRDKGWKIEGVYPKTHSVGNFTIHASLNEVPELYRKFVVVFRSSDKIPEVADEILKLKGIEVVWLQLGISHPTAEKQLETAGIKVVSNRCLKIEYGRWFSTGPKS